MADGHHDGAAATAAPEDWTVQRIAALEGYVPAGDVEAFRAANIRYLSEQIRERSRALAELPEADAKLLLKLAPVGATIGSWRSFSSESRKCCG